MERTQHTPPSVKRYFWDEEGNRVHRARGKCKSGVWYTTMVMASDYDALVAKNAELSKLLDEQTNRALHLVTSLAHIARGTWSAETMAEDAREAISSAKATP